ncbi:hypothetical protein HanOQP8_Chr10g0369031 [Helianthus annuus]|nr:hypothetical protein HanOQP8_Chr10g0369031 [Helianthus annuus]
MRVVHFEFSCAAVSGEPSVPLFCMLYKLISDGDWFTFAKRQNSVSKPSYTFMPTSTYPKEWNSRFIFVSAAMIPESPPSKDTEAAIEDSIPILSADEIVQWKRMYKNPTRAFTFSEGILAMGGLSPSYSVREGTLSGGEESSPDPLPVKQSSHDDVEDLEIRLARKRKTASPKPAPAPRDIRQRLRSASGQKPLPLTKAAFELPPAGIKGSLSKHLRSSSLVSAPLLVSFSFTCCLTFVLEGF